MRMKVLHDIMIVICTLKYLMYIIYEEYLMNAGFRSNFTFIIKHYTCNQLLIVLYDLI